MMLMRNVNSHKDKEALGYVIKQIPETRFPPGETEDCISLYLFPSLHSPRQKARFLGYMVKCLLQAYSGQRKCDNRDSFRNKRLELAGELLDLDLKYTLHMHGGGWPRLCKKTSMEIMMCAELSIIWMLLLWSQMVYREHSQLGHGHIRSSGWKEYLVLWQIWGIQVPLQTLVDLQKTRQQVQYTGNVGDARYPHPSHWVGLAFFLLRMGKTVDLSRIWPLLDLSVQRYGLESEDSDLVVAELRHLRQKKKLPRQVEIKREEQQKEVRIFSDAGRILRPLFLLRIYIK